MTRKEAIEHLEKWKEVISNSHRKKVIDMAIEALSTDAVMRDATAEERAGVQRYIDSISTETVQVVRCKDCRYFKKIVERSDSGLCHRDLVASAWKENGYCSRGERKGGDLK